MSIITRPAPKSSRPTNKSARPFGQGILPSYPVHRAPASFEDMAWAAQAFSDQSATQSGPTDADFDRMADEAAFLDRYTRGYCL